MSERGILIVLSAPSGCGKSTIVSGLLQRRDKLKFSVSATTRAPREGEVDGKDYFFVSHGKFAEMVEKGEFLEHARYVENRYGTPRGPVERELDAGNDVLLDIEIQGAFQVRGQRPDALMVFLLPPSFEELEKRLILRGKDSPEVIRRRLEVARRECLEAEKYDYRIVNDDVERAVSEFNAIIEAERRKINKQ
ncbi:MAG: guanylate kinase [Butyricicoccus sp.]|nr:guanylate kinase [Butyricicoccus sp.]